MEIAKATPTVLSNFWPWKCKFADQAEDKPQKWSCLLKKCVCPKWSQRKQNQNKVSEARTVENIKYEPILS